MRFLLSRAVPVGAPPSTRVFILVRRERALCRRVLCFYFRVSRLTRTKMGLILLFRRRPVMVMRLLISTLLFLSWSPFGTHWGNRWRSRLRVATPSLSLMDGRHLLGRRSVRPIRRKMVLLSLSGRYRLFRARFRWYRLLIVFLFPTLVQVRRMARRRRLRRWRVLIEGSRWVLLLVIGKTVFIIGRRVVVPLFPAMEVRLIHMILFVVRDHFLRIRFKRFLFRLFIE